MQRQQREAMDAFHRVWRSGTATPTELHRAAVSAAVEHDGALRDELLDLARSIKRDAS